MKRTPQEKGFDFEKELADEFALDLVPGSGSQWHSKLDLTTGRTARWSLKYTESKTFEISHALIDEAIDATEGVGGDGSVPVWAIRMADPKHDVIIMRKQDFKLIQSGELQLVNVKRQGTAARKAKAAIPALLRDEDDE